MCESAFDLTSRVWLWVRFRTPLWIPTRGSLLCFYVCWSVVGSSLLKIFILMFCSEISRIWVLVKVWLNCGVTSGSKTCILRGLWEGIEYSSLASKSLLYTRYSSIGVRSFIFDAICCPPLFTSSTYFSGDQFSEMGSSEARECLAGLRFFNGDSGFTFY